jgi:hypothetical protein
LLQQIWDIDEERKYTKLRTSNEDTYIIPWIVDGIVLAYLAYQEDGMGKFSQVEFFGFNAGIMLVRRFKNCILYKSLS